MLQKTLLYPFSVLYDAATRFRNHLYDIRYKPSISFEIPLINVGNLTVGGTGKTPHVEYLIRLLKDRYRVATLSRGYGRKTRGVIIADPDATADRIADEPMQFFTKFGYEIVVAVGERRVVAIPEILHHQPDTEVIILDDAFQHRAVRPDLNILLSDYSRPFYKDVLLPAGRLRESRKGARRADIVIVSKCPEKMATTEREEIKNQISPYTRPEVPVFFTGIRYLPPQPVFASTATLPGRDVVLLTGIANSRTITEKVKLEFNLLKHIELKDHQHYNEALVGKIADTCRSLPGAFLLTTEKDMVKLRQPAFEGLLEGIPVFYLPIEIFFLEEQARFDEMVLRRMSE